MKVARFGCQRRGQAASSWKPRRETRLSTVFHVIEPARDCLFHHSFPMALEAFTVFSNKVPRQMVAIAWSIHKTKKTASNCRPDRRA
jgi:hypothetical protein